MTNSKPKLMLYSEAHVIGGAERYLMQLVPALVNDWDVTVVVRGDVVLPILEDFFQARNIRFLKRAFDGLSWRSYRDSLKLFREEKPDLVLFNLGQFFGAKGARLAAIQSRIPQVLVQHGSPKEAIRRSNWFNRSFTHFALKRTKGLIVPSNSSAAFFKEGYPDGPEPKVIALGIDLEKFNPGLYDKAKIKAELGLSLSGKVMSFVGHMEPNKHPEWALKIFSKLLEANPNLYLIMMGEGSLKNTLKEQSDNSSAKGRIFWLGASRAVAEILAISDVLIHPSEDESFGLVLAEAMAMGVPVAAFKVGAIPEVVGEASELVDFANIEAMVEITQKILTNPELAQKMSQSGQARANQNFSLDRTITETNQMLKDLCPSVLSKSDNWDKIKP